MLFRTSGARVVWPWPSVSRETLNAKNLRTESGATICPEGFVQMCGAGLRPAKEIS